MRTRLRPEDVAAVVELELDRFLRHHHEVASLVIRGEELLRVVALVDVLPAAAVGRFHEDRPAEEREDLVPVHHLHVAERLRVGVGRMLFVRQEDRARHGHIRGLGHEVVEELVVSGPPDRIVHDSHARSRRALEVGAVEQHFVADAIENEIVRKDAVVFEIRDFDDAGLYVLAATCVDGVDEGPGKCVFLTEQNPDLLLAHRVCSPSMWARIVYESAARGNADRCDD